MKKRIKNKKQFLGFTLIELLVVITVIATLAVVVFVALNPTKRLADARDARRFTDVETILTAIHAYIVDNKGSLPLGLTPSMLETQLGTAVTGCAIATGTCNVLGASTCVDLTAGLAKYLKAIPQDPKSGTTLLTNYTAIVDANGIVTIKACGAENGSSISSSR